MAKQKNKNTSKTTKDFVAISEIRDDVVILKNGSMRVAVEIGSTNFELKSQDEQAAIILAFQNFLNSIDFPVQIVVHSRKLDIRPYINGLNQQIEKMDHELLKIQAVEYVRFIGGLTELTNIMSKNFYIVVPFYIIETPISKGGVLDSLKNLIKPSQATQKIEDAKFETYKTQIMQRVELIIDGLMAMGLSADILNNDQLKNLYQKLYLPN